MVYNLCSPICDSRLTGFTWDFVVHFHQIRLTSSTQQNGLGSDFEYEVLTVQPGPGSMFQDVAVWHKSSQTLLICDAVFATTSNPPPILTEEPEYTRALLFHAREGQTDMPQDTPENRQKGWKRIVLLFNFFFPGSGIADLGVQPILQALKTPWMGWMETV